MNTFTLLLHNLAFSDASVLIPLIVLIFGYWLIQKTNLFSSSNKAKSSLDNDKYYTIDDKYNAEKVRKQKELDKLLEKISKKGIDGLSTNERKRLDELSK